jgi:SAM-dependent methyltransferase
MVDIFRYTDVAEAGVAILNPLTEEKLLLLGELADLRPGSRHLDLGCGKGEMLCQYALRHGVVGVGVDIHPPFVEIANARAGELGVRRRVDFRVGDASKHEVSGEFDVVSCIGATWIGGGFTGAIELMKASLAHDGCLLVGEVFLEGTPPSDADDRYDGSLRGIRDLGGLLTDVGACEMELVEMVIATRDDWDQYSSRQWDRASDWLRRNPTDPDAPGIRDWLDKSRQTYLADERNWLGWGVFVLR